MKKKEIIIVGESSPISPNNQGEECIKDDISHELQSRRTVYEVESFEKPKKAKGKKNFLRQPWQ